MLAGKYDITIEQGSEFVLTMMYRDDLGRAVNLVGYTARMQLRSKVTDSTVILSLTTENGRINITGNTGQISLMVDAATTAALAAGSGVYDLEIVNGSKVQRIIEGKYTISPEVTR